MGAIAERRYPLLAGAVAGATFFFLAPSSFPVAADAAPSLFSAIISVAAIAVGFLATAKSILLAGMSVVCFLADLKAPADWHRWIFAAWVFTIFAAGASCFRVIHVFGKILRAKS